MALVASRAGLSTSMRSRSRSPRVPAPSDQAREAVLTEFARLFWLAPDDPDGLPWLGDRAVKIARFRDRLVAQVEAAARQAVNGDADEEGVDACRFHALLRNELQESTATWQRFTFYEDVARMSDVLFRGPIEPRHADDVDFRLHSAWRRVSATVREPDAFVMTVREFRVSAVRVAMMLETARPPEACQIDKHFELPDARTLASLLSLRCEKDDEEELLEMYRLLCQKLEGVSCTWCCRPFDECSSAGLFDGADSLLIPVTVPKVFVPQCGHAIHTLCFGSQLIPDRANGIRGCCRRCGLSYAWTSIDIDPMINAFCLLFGSYVDKRAQDFRLAGELEKSAIMSIAEICNCFSVELNGLIAPASAWLLLAKRHDFEDPEAVEVIGDAVLRVLAPPVEPDLDAPFQPLPPLVDAPAIIGPDDRSDDDFSDGELDSEAEADREQDKHVTEVFLPDCPVDASDALPPVPASDEVSDLAPLE